MNKIKEILGEWNPLDVPEFIKIDEYKSYARKIREDCKNEQDVQEYLKFVFTENFGYELTEQSITDIKDISNRISKFLEK